MATDRASCSPAARAGHLVQDADAGPLTHPFRPLSCRSGPPVPRCAERIGAGAAPPAPEPVARRSEPLRRSATVPATTAAATASRTSARGRAPGPFLRRTPVSSNTARTTSLSTGNSRHRVAMLLENNPYPADVRVRREAESLVEAGHTVCVAAPRAPGQPRRELVRGVQVRRFRAPAGGDGAASLLLEYLVANVALHVAAARELLRGATVLHLHNPPDTLFLAGLLARALGRRVVFDHHDLFPELVMARLRSRAWRAIARAAGRATFATADLVLAANESHAEIARARGRKPAAAVSVVRNGPPAASVDPSPSMRGGRLADPQLVYVGAIAEQDGVELLADVLAELRDVHELPAHLTVVGDGPSKRRVEARMAALGVRGHVSFTGWVEPDLVREHIRAADICVDPAPPSDLNHRSTMV